MARIDRELQLFSTRDFAKLLRASRWTVYEWVRAGLIPRPPRRPWRWTRDQVRGVIEMLYGDTPTQQQTD